MSSSTAFKLDDLIGLSGAKNVVRRLAEDDRGIHALLLYGAKGSGKGELARIVTQGWLCAGDGCVDGSCRPCQAFLRGNSPDVLMIGPQGASNIIRNEAITNPNPGKDDPTPLLTFFRTPPLLSRHKVGIIADAHRMNSSSANALLKTLEEPFPHAKLILTTDTIGSLLPTILSRCLAVACESPSVEELSKAFPNATKDEIRLAEGTAGRLKTVVEKRELYARLVWFAQRLPQRGPAEALIASEEFQGIAEGFRNSTEGGVRGANAEALSALAIYFAREPSCPPAWPQQIIEAHRRILGNGGAGVVFDALFTRLLTMTPNA